ncbi:uncharacterized protein G2W53_009805 [Senna tora]|uniref:Uncharacterized protein n=1 Tax=Senna tora TaxID=362788 RepID=A0A835CAK0_9FABA|nr:uncharacterized protein G2W53_009805 [Senna tora]
MLRPDPRFLPCQDDSNRSIKTTPVREYNANRRVDSLAQQVFCMVSEIRPRFVVRNMLTHDPCSSHAKTAPIGASKPLRFANTTRTDVFDSLAQQVFCLVIREGFRDPTAICRPKYVKTRSTVLPRQDDSNRSIKTTPVSEFRPRFVIRNMIRHDPRSSHAKTTPIGASKPLWFVNTTQTDVFDSLAQQVFCLVIRGGF